jgi:hypothetical protein
MNIMTEQQLDELVSHLPTTKELEAYRNAWLSYFSPPPFHAMRWLSPLVPSNL